MSGFGQGGYGQGGYGGNPGVVPPPPPAPEPPVVAPSVVTATLPRTRRVVPRHEKVGLLRPFRRDGKTDFAHGSGDELLATRVKTVLSIEGDLPWRSEWRAGLDRLRNQKTVLLRNEFARHFVSDVLGKWMPTVRVRGVSSEERGRDIDLTIYVQRANDTSPNPKQIPVKVVIRGKEKG